MTVARSIPFAILITGGTVAWLVGLLRDDTPAWPGAVATTYGVAATLIAARFEDRR